MPVVIVMSVGVFAAALAAFDPEPVTFWTPYPKQAAAMALSEECFELLFGGSAGPGKASDVDLEIPTLDGWTTLGDIRVGDRIYDEHGQPCTVVGGTTIQHDRPCYRITFADGTTLTADAEHEWPTHTATERLATPLGSHRNRVTRVIADTLHARHAIHRPADNTWHEIVAVEAVPSVPVRCIQVDSPSHLYLIGEARIPTHNSHALRGHACDFAYNNPGAHIGIVRRTLPMLKQTHGLHLPTMLRGHARENRTDFTFTFPNRSVIRFISLQHPGDEQAYKSAEFDCLLFDELTEFEESQYTFMLSRVRSARGHRTHVIATSNPEGRGFRWVKRRFVDPRPEDLAEGQAKPQPGEVWAPPIVENGTVIGWHPKRAFMPATVRDNPGLMKSNPGYVQQLMALPDSRLRRALVDGDWTAMDAIPGALWSQSSIDDNRVESVPCDLTRVVVGVDPSGSSANGDRECGIVAVGLGSDGNCYVLEDVSGAMSPDEWARAAAAAYRRHNADRVVAERNFGGEMVLSTLEHAEPNLPVELVNASRGKAVRAEPVAVLTVRRRVKFVGRFPELEDQLTTWTPSDKWSPDRLDAFTWSVVQLMGGAAALAFLSALSAHCPECKAINTAGHPVCFQCGADLPFAQETSAAVVPPGQALTDATPTDPDDDDTPVEPGPVVPPGATVIAGLILP